MTTTSVSNSVTINTNGDIYGTDADGCVYSGSLSLPDSTKNLYRVNLLIESCGNSNGNYTGLMTGFGSVQPSLLLMLVSNDSYGFSFQLERQ